MAATLHDPRYRQLVDLLTEARKATGLTQEAVGERLGKPQSFLGKIETYERRLDALELFDLLNALGVPAPKFARAAQARIGERQLRRKGK